MSHTQEKQTSKSKQPAWLRVLASLFIIYHLLVIAILANNTSYLGRSLGRFLAPYGNTLGLNSSWNFFFMPPEHAMYIHYIVFFDENSEKEPVEGFVPPEKEKIVVDSSGRRFFYLMRFLMSDEKRIQLLLAPYLCRQHPGATNIRIENIGEAIQNLDLSLLTEMPEREARVVTSHDLSCTEAQDEVEL